MEKERGRERKERERRRWKKRKEKQKGKGRESKKETKNGVRERKKEREHFLMQNRSHLEFFASLFFILPIFQTASEYVVSGLVWLGEAGGKLQGEGGGGGRNELVGEHKYEEQINI